MNQLTRKLEVLGPDTADLSMRFGPQWSSDCRRTSGERSRFQLLETR
jgi:hypothetical protein